MYPPRAADGDESRVEVTVHLHRHRMHVERNQHRRVAAAVDVGLVARNVGIVHRRGIVYLGVSHERRGEVTLRVRRHLRRERRRGE